MYRDDFERLAHDIINVVNGNRLSGKAPAWQIEKVADMLRAGPGVTVWPRDAAEAAQVARERTLRKPLKLLPPITLPPLPMRKLGLEEVAQPFGLVLPLVLPIPPKKSP